MGPVAVKTYPGAVWQPGLDRATFDPDYGRRGKVWVHGAFEPATGQAEIVISERRDSVSHIALIEKVVEKFPSEKWLLIEDNLSTHHSRDVKTALLAWPENWGAVYPEICVLVELDRTVVETVEISGTEREKI